MVASTRGSSTITRRLRVLQLVFFSFSLVISARLGYWQVIKAKSLQSQAQDQQLSSRVLPAVRGDIKSSDGFALAASINHYLLYVNPHLFPKDRNLWQELVRGLSSSDSALLALSQASKSESYWYPIAHKLTSQSKKRLEDLNLPGQGFELEPDRAYPEGTSSAHLLGFVGKDDAGLPRGYFGLEGFYNRLLSGRPGRLIQEKDASNRPIAIGEDFRLSPQPGQSLITSIDRTVQYHISKSLEEGLRRFRAESGTVSVMDPATGRILGIVALPGYDPARYQHYNQDLYKNPVISESFEPGSTFKTLIMAAALDTGAIGVDTTCDLCSGPVRIGEHVVRTWDDQYHPRSNMPDILKNSDNIGMVFVGRRLGKSRLLSYLAKFGLGKLTGVDLQGETSPPLRPESQWRDIDLATATFGQGIAVTPLQMLRAVGAIANQGRLVTPHLVTGTEGRDSQKLTFPPPVRIISPKAAIQTTQMMVYAVEHGGIKNLKPSGYTIAGKTGTAQIPIAGHYDPDKVIVSFVGFAPADKPRFVMLVTLRDPKSSSWGSTTAAPLWFEIAAKLLKYYDIPPGDIIIPAP